tara:strand:- start:1610 stop:1816 length:207 start_codon:yes stop_codon:yes gene_type:complete
MGGVFKFNIMTYLYITLSLIIFGLILYPLIKLTHFLVDLHSVITGYFEESEIEFIEIKNPNKDEKKQH